MSDVIIHLGDWRLSLSAARNNLNYSQEYVAKYLGIGKITLSRWERGETVIDAENLFKLKELYKLPSIEMLSLHQQNAV